MSPRAILILKRTGLALLIVLVIAAFVAMGVALRLLRHRTGEGTAEGPTNIFTAAADARQIIEHPEDGFPGQSRVNILCMGLDDNWTDRDEVYTAQARSDTLFILSLDLANRKAAMLSIPRDTYAHIVGTDWHFKVNAAYQTGGPARAIATVDELLGVHCDHYIVLNINATRDMVNALGGVDVDVKHAMHYHDTWGHLSIDLEPGFQHLDGDQAVGFARYRHPDAGAPSSPEDGDDRRMERQHDLLKAMVAKAKDSANFMQAPHLVDVAMSAVRTDLTRTQLFDIAEMYRHVTADDIRTASLPGEDFRGPKGAWFFRLYPNQAKAYVDWLIRGRDDAARALTPVTVENATSKDGLAVYAAAQLQDVGYTDVRVMKLQKGDGVLGAPATSIRDTGVPDPDAGKTLASVLGVPSAVVVRQPVAPNHLGWKPPATVKVVLGDDYKLEVENAQPVPPNVASTTSGSLARTP